MTRRMRNAGLLFAALLVGTNAWAQNRPVWRTSSDVVEGVAGSIVGTVADLGESGDQITIQTGDDQNGRITVATDSVSTQYNGFGGVIAGKPEIFTGSRGFSNVRQGDRLEIRGVGRGNGIVRADQIALLGRPVPAPQTGVGTTRSPSSGISTPTVGSTANVYARVEGVVRQVNAVDNRIVVETDRREIFNVRASGSTPVTYRGDRYQVSNLEVGDRVRIESDGASGADREVQARSIEVIRSVQEGTGARVSSISGRVTRTDRAADIASVDTGRGEVRVDMAHAYDSTGRRVRAADLQVGDRLDISGDYGPRSNVFSATTVRFGDEDVLATPTAPPGPDYAPELVTITMSGTVTETLQNAAMLSIRDRVSGRVVVLYVTEDFAVRTKSGSYITADRLNVNDNVIVKAYRDGDGNLIAQTIRVR